MYDINLIAVSRRLDRYRLWLLFAFSGVGVVLQLYFWQQSFEERVERISRRGAMVSAIKERLQPLSHDDGAIYLENPNEVYYYYTVYFAFPRPVYITDRNVVINNNEDILAASKPMTRKNGKRLGVTCLIRPHENGFAIYDLD
jgi:hypothetical protein